MEVFAQPGPEKVVSCKAWDRLVSLCDKKSSEPSLSQKWNKEQQGSGSKALL